MRHTWVGGGLSGTGSKSGSVWHSQFVFKSCTTLRCFSMDVVLPPLQDMYIEHKRHFETFSPLFLLKYSQAFDDFVRSAILSSKLLTHQCNPSWFRSTAAVRPLNWNKNLNQAINVCLFTNVVDFNDITFKVALLDPLDSIAVTISSDHRVSIRNPI